LIVTTFFNVCGGAALARPEATQDRVGMIPRDWHRELKMTTLAAAAPGRGGRRMQLMREIASWRDVDVI
jgi:hypothetical protein